MQTFFRIYNVRRFPSLTRSQQRIEALEETETEVEAELAALRNQKKTLEANLSRTERALAESQRRLESRRSEDDIKADLGRAKKVLQTAKERNVECKVCCCGCC